MKIISLNTWGGIAGAEKLVEFFNAHQDIDIFCLQEIFNGGEDDLEEIAEKIEGKVYDLLSKIKNALPNHSVYFYPHLKDYYGLAMFVKKDLEVIDEGERFVHINNKDLYVHDLGNHSRNIQYVTVKSETGPITVINFHGLWNGQGKGDSESRLNQSKKIIEFMETLPDDFIICGDFNLEPETQSIKLLEDFGLRNLVKEYGITSTRTSFYTKPGKFADYGLVSKNVKVEDFKVLPDEVSDHSPLFLEI